MNILHIDLETFSSVDIKKSGLYKYVQSPDFEILLFGYAYNDLPVQVIDLAQGERIPAEIIRDLNNHEIVKMAHNAAFEYNALSKFYKTSLDQWRCSMIHAYYCGYPGSLDAIGNALGFAEDRKKLNTGKALIRYFCCPCKPTASNGQRTRNYPKNDPSKWELFKTYNKQDVVAEREIENILSVYPVPDTVYIDWLIDQQIAQRGVALDLDLIDGAIEIADKFTTEKKEKAQRLTGLENPNSVAQLKAWLEANIDTEIGSVNKETVGELLENVPAESVVAQVLKLRKETGKSSVKKYQAMRDCAGADGRVRGILQYYGAQRTGRWAGRLVQVQNLPRNYIETLDNARQVVKMRTPEAVGLIYGDVMDTLSQLIRTALVAAPGTRFVVADFSAIEARVIAWLSGENWRQEVFRTHGKIYEASASNMFGVPIETIVKGNENYKLRQKGKIAELALGYGGSTGALMKMGALNMGLTEEELPDIVHRWRQANRRIVDFWYSVEQAAIDCVGKGITTTLPSNISFYRDRNYMFIVLPSGRKLFYKNPRIGLNNFGGDEIFYEGTDQKKGKWGELHAYGGKFVENIVQAVARDLLAESIGRLVYAGYPVVFHIHDEVISECPYEDKRFNLGNAIQIMCEIPPWAEGLVLNAAGFESEYYMKD